MADRVAPTGTGATAARGIAELSPRELEVLDMLSTGMTNDEIARQLFLSIHAVKFHLGGIYRKLGVVNRTEATSAYLRDGSAGKHVSSIDSASHA